MKFLVDAQLPRRVAVMLRRSGYDAVHTLELPRQNRTPDDYINQVSELERRVVITKDADFVTSFHLLRRPYKLLLISTGNIKNSDLERLMEANLARLVTAFEENHFIELNQTWFIIHE